MKVLDLVLAEDNTLHVCLKIKEATSYYEECIKKISEETGVCIDYKLFADHKHSREYYHDELEGTIQVKEYSSDTDFKYSRKQQGSHPDYRTYEVTGVHEFVWINLDGDYSSHRRSIGSLRKSGKMEDLGPKVAEEIRRRAAIVVEDASNMAVNMLSGTFTRDFNNNLHDYIPREYPMLSWPREHPWPGFRSSDLLSAYDVKHWSHFAKVLDLQFKLVRTPFSVDAEARPYCPKKESNINLHVRYRPVFPEEMDLKLFFTEYLWPNPDCGAGNLLGQVESIRRSHERPDGRTTYSNSQLKNGDPTKYINVVIKNLENLVGQMKEQVLVYRKALKDDQKKILSEKEKYKKISEDVRKAVNNGPAGVQDYLSDLDKKFAEDDQKWESLLPEMDKIAKVAENSAKSQLSARIQGIEKTGYGHGETSKGGKQKKAYSTEDAALLASQREAKATSKRTKKDTILKRVYDRTIRLSEYETQKPLIKKDLEQLLAKEGFKNYEISFHRDLQYDYHRNGRREASIVITVNDLEYRRHQVHVDCDEERTYYFLTANGALRYIYEP